MPGKHPPGYHGRRQRIRTAVLDDYRDQHPEEYERAWAAAEARENRKEKQG